MTCYQVSGGGIVKSTATKMCGEDGIQHLRNRGYLCQWSAKEDNAPYNRYRLQFYNGQRAICGTT